MKKIIITISREYGSGGRQIGQRVARELGIDFYNRNLIDMVAKESGLAAEYIDKMEEKLSSRFIWGQTLGWRMPGGYYSNEDKMYITQSNIIRDVAAKGPCVIVGRCADYVLSGREEAMNVFVRADLDSRLQRLVNEYGVDAKRARRHRPEYRQGPRQLLPPLHRPGLGRYEQLSPDAGQQPLRHRGGRPAHRRRGQDRLRRLNTIGHNHNARGAAPGVFCCAGSLAACLARAPAARQTPRHPSA